MIFNPRQYDYDSRPLFYLQQLIKQKKPFEIKTIRKKRTNLQNRYLHLAFRQVEIETGYSMQEVKQVLFKKICNPDIFIAEGQIGKYYRSSADLDTLEMTKAIDRFRDYVSSEIGLYIPAPNEEEKIHAWEAELSRYSYL